MKKQKREKIKNIWNKIKKPLMIISIIGNILFLFSIIVGCASVKRKPVSQVSASYEDVQLNDTTWVFVDVPIQPQTSSLIQSIRMPIESNGRTYNAFRYAKTSGGSLDYISYGDNSNKVYTASNGWTNSAYKTIHIISEPSDATEVLPMKKFLALNATQVIDEPEEPEEPEEEQNNYVSTIYIGDNFIPASFVTTNGDYIFNGFAGKHTNGLTHIIHLTGLTFVSNNETFNRISLTYSNLNAVTSRVTQDGTTLVDTTSYGDYLCCVAIKYEYVNGDNVTSSIVVCSPRRTIVVEDGQNYNVFDVRSPFNVWINDEYRKINVVEDLGTIQNDELLTIQNKSTLELLQVTTNVNQSVMGFSNVFHLLGGAFAGLGAILGISILPGITLGLLLFIPLIVIIITTVIKIIKK